MLKIIGGKTLPKSEIIPTPSWGLNYVLDGGLLSGRFHTMWGNPSAGKTTFFLKTMGLAQDLGYTPIIIDAEGSYTDEWGAKNGIDLSKRVYYRTNTVNDLIDEIKSIDKEHEKYIILVDSVNAIVSEKFFEGKASLAGSATSQKDLLLTLAATLDPTRNAVFLVAQQSIHGIGTTSVGPAANIGNATEHWSTNIIKLFASKSRDNLERESETETILNKKVAWTLQKSKQASKEGTKGNYWFNLGDARVDMANEVADIAVYNGVIKKSGAWFVWNDAKYHGLKALVEDLDQEKMDQILDQLKGMKVHFEVAPEDMITIGRKNA